MGPENESTPMTSRGRQVGRYIVVDPIGQGGMGQVFSAYDPELDRRVALKLVRVTTRKSNQERARERMLREAQALAKLAHPNVVTVFDAGTHEDHVFIAMEQIQGTTLKGWLTERARSWTEVVDVMRQTGRGLAAAHGAGLVHRDFKPANVMIGEDGRPRVLDFGLARRYEPTASEDEAIGRDVPERILESLERSGPSVDMALTATGVVLGTPAYMAPEQFMGGSIDARTDQFAFCVVLFRALFGIPPFEGKDFRTLGRAVARGELVTPPRQGGIPRSIRQALEQGLSVSKNDRFERMESLLEVLDHAFDAPRRRRRRIGLGAGIGTAAIALAVVGSATSASDAASPCEGVEQRIEGAWDASRRQEVEAAFGRSDAPYAADASQRVVELLDLYAEQWGAMRRDACEATQIRKEQSEALMDLRIACLVGRRRELEAVVDVLVTADDVVVPRAVGAVQQLPSLSWCSDGDALRADVAPPEDPEVRAQTEQIAGELPSAWALLMAGRYGAAQEQATPLLERARVLGHAATVAEVARVLGMAQTRSGNADAAAESLDEALWAAIESGHLQEQIWVLTELAALEATHRPEGGSAQRHIRHAEAVLARLPATAHLDAIVALQRGTVAMRRRDWDQAEQGYRRTIELAGDTMVTQRAKLSAMANLAMSLAVQGKFEAARAQGEATLEVTRKALGERHPSTIQIMQNLASMAMENGDPAEAIAEMSHVLELQEEALEPDNPMLAQTLGNLGMAYRELGDWKAVLGTSQRALEIKRATLSADDTSIAVTATNVGDALLRTGRVQEARTLYEEALGIFGEAAERIYVLPGLGEALRRTGDTAEARVMLEDGLGRLDDAPISERDRALLRWELGRLRWELGERELGRAQIEQARESMASVEGNTAQARRDVEAWLRKHPDR